MNYKSIGHFVALIAAIEAVFLLPALLLALAFGEPQAVFPLLWTIGIALALSGLLFLLTRGARREFHEKEGLACVSLGWIVMSLIGCLPFFFSGKIPSFVDALFESVSGFTTTGSTILSEVASWPRSLLYWRSFTHWVGGMGVLVLLLALAPTGGQGFTMHLMRAESPGPSVGKLVPQIRKTARILYLIYFALTLLETVLLLIARMPLFDAVCIAFGTAGTGGFGVTNGGLADYSPAIQTIVGVFMFIFGVNFSCYYLILIGKIKNVLKDEELRWYMAFSAIGIAVITFNIRAQYGTLGESLRHAFFQVGSIISTTGFATTDFNQWPLLSQAILVFFMFTGASAGSTCGGMKMSRVIMVLKNLRRNLRQIIRPNRVSVVRVNKAAVDEGILSNVNTYLACYVIILIVSFLLLAPDMPDMTSGFTAIVACFNNIGPGLNVVGPMGNFSGFSDFSKIVLIFDMLAGRLEIFPMLALFSTATWSHR